MVLTVTIQFNKDALKANVKVFYMLFFAGEKFCTSFIYAICGLGVLLGATLVGLSVLAVRLNRYANEKRNDKDKDKDVKTKNGNSVTQPESQDNSALDETARLVIEGVSYRAKTDNKLIVKDDDTDPKHSDCVVRI